MATVGYDARLNFPTHGLIQKVVLSEQGARQLLIPVGVWHLNVSFSTTETLLINHPTRVYHHAAPDRLTLPWDSPAIPFDVSSPFPIQLKDAADHSC